MEFSKSEIEILQLAIIQLDKFYDEREQTCREFKWICHKYLPQAGEGYIENKNVFDIQDKTIEDIKKAKEDSRKLLMKIINQ